MFVCCIGGEGINADSYVLFGQSNRIDITGELTDDVGFLTDLFKPVPDGNCS
jgi:hypothetical protein